MKVGLIGAVFSIFLLTGCTGSTIYRQGSLGGVETLSVDAKQRLIISGVRNSDHRRVTCAEPSPDALVAQAAVLSARGQLPAPTAGASGSGDVSFGFQEAAGSIGLRTQSIQILRDGYYRLCEAYLNDAINAKEYQDISRNIDSFISVALAIDGLSNAKAVPAVAIGSGDLTLNAGSGASSSGESATVKPAQPVIHDVISSGISQSSTPAAVAQIVRDYLNHKEDQTCFRNRLACDRLTNTQILVPSKG